MSETKAEGKGAGPLVAAWVGVALIPVFVGAAFLAGFVVTGLLEPDDPQRASLVGDLVAAAAMLAIVAVPCLFAGVAGSRAVSAGDRRGRLPRTIGVVVLAGSAVLAFVAILANVIGGDVYG